MPAQPGPDRWRSCCAGRGRGRCCPARDAGRIVLGVDGEQVAAPGRGRAVRGGRSATAAAAAEVRRRRRSGAGRTRCSGRARSPGARRGQRCRIGGRGGRSGQSSAAVTASVAVSPGSAAPRHGARRAADPGSAGTTAERSPTALRWAVRARWQPSRSSGFCRAIADTAALRESPEESSSVVEPGAANLADAGSASTVSRPSNPASALRISVSRADSAGALWVAAGEFPAHGVRQPHAQRGLEVVGVSGAGRRQRDECPVGHQRSRRDRGLQQS